MAEDRNQAASAPRKPKRQQDQRRPMISKKARSRDLAVKEHEARTRERRRRRRARTGLGRKCLIAWPSLGGGQVRTAQARGSPRIQAIGEIHHQVGEDHGEPDQDPGWSCTTARSRLATAPTKRGAPPPARRRCFFHLDHGQKPATRRAHHEADDRQGRDGQAFGSAWAEPRRPRPTEPPWRRRCGYRAGGRRMAQQPPAMARAGEGVRITARARIMPMVTTGKDGNACQVPEPARGQAIFSLTAKTSAKHQPITKLGTVKPTPDRRHDGPGEPGVAIGALAKSPRAPRPITR